MTASWLARSLDPLHVAALRQALGLSSPMAHVLVGRGWQAPGEVERFLSPKLAGLRPPKGLADFERAVARLGEAIGRGETIGVYGDYDVDGITSTALLTTFLRGCGARVHADLGRREDGYGLRPCRVEELASRGVSVIVVCDCGTSDHEAVAALEAKGVSVIVLDHHHIPTGEHPAFALINPHRQDSTFPFRGLASVGLAFYVVAGLRTWLRGAGRVEVPDPRSVLDLVALGTVADMAPLVDENRILVSAGLEQIRACPRPGLQVLAPPGSLAFCRASDIGFRLAPRLNAPGRMGRPNVALELLLATDLAMAERWASECEAANRQRQAVQAEVFSEASVQADSLMREALSAPQGSDTGEDAAGFAGLVVAGQGWHEGVLGIVAAKLLETHGRTAVVLSGRDGMFRGSIRAAAGVHAQAVLAELATDGLLERWGGHAAAAGVTLKEENLPAFRLGFNRLVAAGAKPIAAAHEVDAEVSLSDVDDNVALELERLEPCGMGNPAPTFGAICHTERTNIVGQSHLQLVLRQGEIRRQAIAFRQAHQDPGSDRPVRVAFVPELDTYRGVRRLRFRVTALEVHGTA